MDSNAIELSLEGKAASWKHRDGSILGQMVLDDPWKPYLHPVNTYKGNCVTDAMPVDHRHHKGIMYALRCDDLNFWEEEPDTSQAGVQNILETRATDSSTLQLRLLWSHESGKCETYEETRTITFADHSKPGAYKITWQTMRTALRDHELIQSQWSMKLENGRLVNYHGLGIRLPWAWTLHGLPQWGGVEVDGQLLTDPAEACGSEGQSVRWSCGFDGKWWHDAGAVTLSQSHGFTFYSVRKGIPYLATGPTASAPMSVKEGAAFKESYEILVEDLDSLDADMVT